MSAPTESALGKKEGVCLVCGATVTGTTSPYGHEYICNNEKDGKVCRNYGILEHQERISKL